MNNSFFVTKNWESDIRKVQIESCDSGEDPLGYRAVFFLSDGSPRNITFTVGASTLQQRARNLAQAGYIAPMTQKAIALLENRMDGAVSAFAA